MPSGAAPRRGKTSPGWKDEREKKKGGL
jgi:hypothetical protein